MQICVNYKTKCIAGRHNGTWWMSLRDQTLSTTQFKKAIPTYTPTYTLQSSYWWWCLYQQSQQSGLLVWEPTAIFSLNLALLYYVLLLLILVAKGLYFQKLLDDMLSPLSNLRNSRWRPRWPALHIHDQNSLPVHHRKEIVVSIPRF